MANRLKHIPEMDGLRAVAVLLVVAFHVGVLPGGMVGVDVFFVLSGWLITGLLAEEAERTDGVDLAAFLVRRTRRLAPALFAMLAVYTVCLPLAPWLMSPRGESMDKRSLGGDLDDGPGVGAGRAVGGAQPHLVAGHRGAILSGLAVCGPGGRPA